MKKLVSAAIAVTAMFAAGSAGAVVLTLDTFGVPSSATSGTTDTQSGGVGDLFTTRTIGANGDPSALIAVAGGQLDYQTAVNTGNYDLIYNFATAVDLTGGKGTASAADLFQVQIAQNDFPFQVNVSVNGGASAYLGESPFFVNSPTIASFQLSDFGVGISAVTQLSFNLLPVFPGSGVPGAPANQADGVLSFLQFDIEPAPPVSVPAPAGFALFALGLLGMRRLRK